MKEIYSTKVVKDTEHEDTHTSLFGEYFFKDGESISMRLTNSRRLMAERFNKLIKKYEKEENKELRRKETLGGFNTFVKTLKADNELKNNWNSRSIDLERIIEQERNKAIKRLDKKLEYNIRKSETYDRTGHNIKIKKEHLTAGSMSILFLAIVVCLGLTLSLFENNDKHNEKREVEKFVNEVNNGEIQMKDVPLEYKNEVEITVDNEKASKKIIQGARESLEKQIKK